MLAFTRQSRHDRYNHGSEAAQQPVRKYVPRRYLLPILSHLGTSDDGRVDGMLSEADFCVGLTLILLLSQEKTQRLPHDDELSIRTICTYRPDGPLIQFWNAWMDGTRGSNHLLGQ